MDEITIRSATAADVEPLVRMLADDSWGATRDSPEDLEPFQAIDSDPNQILVVADGGNGPVGTLQLSIIPGLSRSGATRGQIEGSACVPTVGVWGSAAR